MIEIYKNESVEYKTRESAGFMFRACQYYWRLRLPMIGDRRWVMVSFFDHDAERVILARLSEIPRLRDPPSRATRFCKNLNE